MVVLKAMACLLYEWDDTVPHHEINWLRILSRVKHVKVGGWADRQVLSSVLYLSNRNLSLVSLMDCSAHRKALLEWVWLAFSIATTSPTHRVSQRLCPIEGLALWYIAMVTTKNSGKSIEPLAVEPLFIPRMDFGIPFLMERYSLSLNTQGRA